MDVLDLRAGAEALYDGAVAAGPLRDGLEAAGFRLHQSATDDPDWPEQRLLADHARRAVERRLAELSGLQAAQTARIAELEGHLGTLHHEANAKAHRITELEQALDATRSWGREQESLAGERAARIAELEQALDATRSWGQQNEALLQDRDGRIGHLEGELAGQHQRADHDRSQIAALERARGEAVAALAASEGRATQLGDLATVQVARLETALAEALGRAGQLGDLAAGRAAKLTAAEQALTAATLELAAKSTALTEGEAALAAAVVARNAAASARNLHEAKAKEQADLAAARGVKLAELETALATAGQALEAKARDLAQATAAVTEAKAAVAKSAQVAEQVTAEAAKLRSAGDELTRQNRALDADLGQVRQAMTTAVRMQAIAQADLRSLQHKFTELAGLKDEQEALLRKLMPRLQEAAAQFRGLMELPGAVPSTALIDPNAGVKQQADLKPKKDKKGAKRGKKK